MAEKILDTGSNPVSEAVSAPVERPEVEATPSAPPTAREAIERAMRTVEAQPRDQQGKWTAEQQAAKDLDNAAKALGKPAAPDPVKVTTPAAAVAAEPVAPSQPVITPPSRLSREAQAEWDKAPPIVRAEVDRAFGEMTKGLEQYQQRWEPLRQFDEMARQGGTTIDVALSNYVNMENEIRRDPVRGLALVCQNAGLDPAQVGAALAGMQPTNGASPDVAPLMNKIAELERQISGVSQSFEQRQVEQTLSDFSRDKPDFEQYRMAMGKLIDAGIVEPDLSKAYEMAKRLQPPAPQPMAVVQPASPAAIIPAPAQTRKPTLQITGSNNAPSNGSMKPASSTREAIMRAKERAGL